MKSPTERDLAYRNRLLTALAGVQLLLLLAIRIAPARTGAPEPRFSPAPAGDPFAIEAIAVTRQAPPRVVPMPPSVPPPRLTDRVIEDPLDLPEEWFEFTSPPLDTGGGLDSEGDPIVTDPARPPVPIRIVEPRSDGLLPETYRSNVRVRVGFEVEKDGSVSRVVILTVELKNADGRFEPWSAIPERVLREVELAAGQWEFRPAVHQNRTVRAYVTDLFRF